MKIKIFLITLLLLFAITPTEAKRCKRFCFEPENPHLLERKPYWPITTQNGLSFMMVPNHEVSAFKVVFIGFMDQAQIYPVNLTENQWTFESPIKKMSFAQLFAASLVDSNGSDDWKSRAVVTLIPYSEGTKVMIREESIVSPGNRYERTISPPQDPLSLLWAVSSSVVYVNHRAGLGEVGLPNK